MLVTFAGVLLLSGGASAQGNCSGSPVTILGTPGDDVLNGTPGNDVIDSQGGNDTIDAGAGDDIVCAGVGVDQVEGGQGNDRVDGGTEDDLLVGDLIEGGQEVGSGDDDLEAGSGFDVVIGDSASSSGAAGGQGNDQLNGGSENDIVIGDAFSGVLAIGIGADDIQGGPGTDITVGDAMVGTPTSASEGPVAPIGEDGGAFGSGDDSLRTQTEDDLLVGDAVSWVRDDFGARSTRRAPAPLLESHPASSYCGTRFVRQVIKRQLAGWDETRLTGEARDVLKSEGLDDLMIGDCLSALGLGTGSGADTLNGGTENDAAVGGNVGAAAQSTSADQDGALGGKGDDYHWGDAVALTNAASASGFVAGDVGLKVLLALTGEAHTTPFGSLPFTNAYTLDVKTGHAQRSVQENAASGGGKDDLSGGQGDDDLEGGPKKDKCSGGPGSDEFVIKGPFKCEEITGDP